MFLVFWSLFANAVDTSSVSVTNNERTGKRIALVIGNSSYQYTDNLPLLINPKHDAEDIAKALRGFGFDVIEKTDLSLEGMSDAVTEFSRKIGNSDAALFYFAGHGLQVKGQNYLLPVDAKIETEAQVPFKSFNVNLVLDEMDNARSRANIVFLDACRNNPISGKFRSGATRGLAAPISQPKGTVIVYATDPGNVAADGEGRNGLFTQGLLTAFKDEDLSLGAVLTRASEVVERASGQKQSPYINGPATMQKNFQFQAAKIARVPAIQTQPAIVDATAQELESWSLAKEINNEAAYMAYLADNANGRHAKFALAELKKIKDNILNSVAAQASNQPKEDKNNKIGIIANKAKNDAVEVEAISRRADLAKNSKENTKSKSSEITEDELWSKADSTKEKADLEAYIHFFPTGRFIAMAQTILKSTLEIRFTHPEMLRIPGKNYELGKFEVTQAEWRAVMGNNPSFFQACGDECPVEHVSWEDVQNYLVKLNRLTNSVYRLPSQIEWQYACYAIKLIKLGKRHGDVFKMVTSLTGTAGVVSYLEDAQVEKPKYCGSSDLDAIAWNVENSSNHTHKIGQKRANGFGLFDMSGNVGELTSDCNGEDCDTHVLVGGSWQDKSTSMHADDRVVVSKAYLSSVIGFRLARTLE
jgi:uncharacterized caspase-like protein/formylglycine-generating enzyme required for sulfatase activity